MAEPIRLWFERDPALLEKHRVEMEWLGFGLDQRALETERVVRFSGYSRYQPDRQIIITYPDGFPSLAPVIKSPSGGPAGLLARHQTPGTGLLCAFGFAESRWRAYLTPYDVVREAEQLIRDLQPGAPIPNDDVVPEPRIRYYDYEPGWGILIPPPFADMTLQELRGYTGARIRIRREGKLVRGILTHMLSAGRESRADSAFLADWESWNTRTQVRNVSFRVLGQAPPLLQGGVAIRQWMRAARLRIRTEYDGWAGLVFDDEWGSRLQSRPAWLMVHSAHRRVRWVQCYPVTRHDQTVRTPFGTALAEKRILMVGCGTLGSAAAIALAQEGVGEMVLFDPDTYEPGNAVRHQVGIPQFGRPKVDGVLQRIRELAPNCRVRAHPFSVGRTTLQLIRDTFGTEFQRANIIVDTTGSQSVNHYLNSLCVMHNKPLVIGSVTNGVWSAEILRYRPGESGCRMCWLLSHGDLNPTSAPREALQFAPGCDQPTFVGGAADVMVAGGLVARMATETLVRGDGEHDYLLWTNRDGGGRWGPSVRALRVDRHPQCPYCSA